jgi:signal transduction histidine kinase
MILPPAIPMNQRFWFNATQTRAFLETVILSVVFWTLLLLMPTDDLQFAPFVFALSALVAPFCLLLYVLRLRLRPFPITSRHLLDAIIGMALGLLLALAGLLFVALVYLKNPSIRKLPSSTEVYTTVAIMSILFTCANWTIYLIVRSFIRLLRFWNRLRRRHLLWALTNSHIILVASLAGFFILLVDIGLVISFSANARISNLLMLIPATLLLMIPSVIAMCFIVPPIAAVSYLVIKRVTDRLRHLTLATSALRAGNYSVRVKVQGEDEVSQLQHDFNAMAANLERTMRALQEERDRVAQLLQERRELIANVSHELRTPIATMRGYLETTLMHWDEMTLPRLQYDLRVMEEEALQLQARVEDLFTLARADIGVLKLEMIPMDAAELVNRIVNARAPLAWRSSRIEVIADIEPALPKVIADPNRLAQALQNLLHNGLRHTAPGGIVAVVVRACNNQIVFQVKDTGEGIAPRDLPHIWERFYQTDNARTRLGGGTGLGLALVKEWIEGMGGHVSAESEPGQGSCFTLQLPCSTVQKQIPSHLPGKTTAKLAAYLMDS